MLVEISSPGNGPATVSKLLQMQMANGLQAGRDNTSGPIGQPFRCSTRQNAAMFLRRRKGQTKACFNAVRTLALETFFSSLFRTTSS